MAPDALLILLPGPVASEPQGSSREDTAPPPRPSARPLGRAALRLESEGHSIFLGASVSPEHGSLVSWRAAPDDRWQIVDLPAEKLIGVHDRFPSQERAAEWVDLRERLRLLPFGNPPDITLLCKDKLRCAEWLATRSPIQPEVVGDNSKFRDALADWGSGFLKPRFGSQGVGIEMLRAGEVAQKRLEACAPGEWVLQRAVPPPRGLAGLAVRVLVQASQEGTWIGPAVARRSTCDPIVNVSRGAEALPAEEVLSSALLLEITEHASEAAGALRDASTTPELVLELGLDFVIDDSHRPWLIEANSCPRGRLLHLAKSQPERWAKTHEEAILRPLRRLLALR